MGDETSADARPPVRRDGAVFLLVCGFFLLCYFRLLTIGYFRPDDLARTLQGYYHWSDDGRPLTTLVLRLLAFDASSLRAPNGLIDDAPLPQFLSIGLMGLCGMLLHRCFPALTAARAATVAILLFATPFMIEPFSYIFDSLGVVASMALGLAGALLLMREPPRRRDVVAAWACLLAALLFYQTGLNVFLAFASGQVLFLLATGRSGAPAAAARAIGAAVAALGSYLAAIWILRGIGVSEFHAYQIAHSRIIPPGAAIAGIAGNLLGMGRYVASVLGIRSLYAVLIACSVATLAVRAIAGARLRPAPTVLALLALCCLGASFAGPMLLLADPILAPRVFGGVGGVIAASWLFGALQLRTRLGERASAVLAIGLMACFARYSFAYGAMARDFDRYETFTCPTIARQINALSDSTGVKRLAIIGSLPYPASIRHSYDAFPGLRPIPVNQTGIDAFAQALLVRYGLSGSLSLVEVDRADACRRRTIETADGFALWSDGQTLYLVFQSGC